MDSEIDESSDTDSIPTIEAIDSILNNMNRDSALDQTNTKIDEKIIDPNDAFYKSNDTSKQSKSLNMLILHRIVDSLFFFMLILSIIFFFISVIAFIFEVGISFYSVIMMNYVFFVSSIVSYTMAPIYQSLSGDWLNFIFSFTQVILASPLIAFYIFYILKSVLSLVSFISEIPSVIKHVFLIIMVLYRELYVSFLANFCEPYLQIIFKRKNKIKILKLSGLSLFLLILAAGFAYVEFCFDKTIIIFGSICYVTNTIQIILLILPSYLYFFQTLLNIKCKEVQYVIEYIELMKYLLELFPEDSDSDQDSSDLEKENKNKSESEELSTDESDSTVMNRLDDINMPDENKKINKHRKEIKIIDDSDISDFVDEDKETYKKFEKLINMLLQLIQANSYFCLYHYSKTIAFDNHRKKRKIALMYTFFILNLAVISYDIYQLTQNYSAYFLSSVVIRFIFIPLFSYYNITSIFFHKSKNSTLNNVLVISSILTVLIAVAVILCFQFTNFYQAKFRIESLEYVPLFDNITVANQEMTKHPICDYKIFDVSAFDAFGYSLGGYDIKRNKTVFDNQMKIFFNENYSDHISYKIHELDEHFLFIKYYDSSIDTHIFAFRGYNSGPEIAFQLEILATHYIIPFFEDIVPFYELINEYWLKFYIDFLNSFGLKFFECNNLMVEYVNSIIDVFNKENLDDEERILFAGINCGGVFAKIVGTLLHRKSISFISFPIDNDLFETMFEYSSSFISLVTNVYNVDGFFSDQEPRYATNIAIDMPIFEKTKFCTSGACEIFSKTDNVYRTFCTISEICGKGNQFYYYCENTIGKDLETIRESLRESD